jgi:hypothetical protein
MYYIYLFNFLFFNPYIRYNPYRVIFNGCKVNVDYEPLKDDPVRVETYVGVEE